MRHAPSKNRLCDVVAAAHITHDVNSYAHSGVICGFCGFYGFYAIVDCCVGSFALCDVIYGSCAIVDFVDNGAGFFVANRRARP
jgi:hypothetical protein